jgi:hypothetical protein
MSRRVPTKVDRALARMCHACPVCRSARARQAGMAYEMVRKLEAKVCPFCQAYERVHGWKAYERAARAKATDR